ncbi:dihydrolipoamide dehydrogenase, partial [Planococcus sp. SIMBA_143]
LIATMEKGLQARFHSSNIECVKGQASFLSENRIGAEQGEKFEVWSFNHAILATGSSPIMPNFLSSSSHPNILPLEHLYTLSSLPTQLILFGSDYLTIE